MWGRGERFGVVPIGRERVYWFATANVPEGGGNSKDQKEELLRRFGTWAEPVAELISLTPETAIFRNDIYDRQPLEQWGMGRVTLLGDAAHPMTPNLGQGACQAVEDAVVLADCLSNLRDVSKALRTYESRRIGRTTALVSLPA